MKANIAWSSFESFVIPASQNGCPTTDQVRRDAKPVTTVPEPVESSIVAALTRPAAFDETLQQAAEGRERAVRDIFSTLSPAQSLVLGRRLDANRDSDRVAVAFRRLTGDRRLRLRTYLTDARRRAPLASQHVKAGGL